MQTLLQYSLLQFSAKARFVSLDSASLLGFMLIGAAKVLEMDRNPTMNVTVFERI